MATCCNTDDGHRSLREMVAFTTFQRCARYLAPSAGRHGLPLRDGYLCPPSTFEHVLAAMWSFARTSDVFLDDGALLNCRTAPKYPNVRFGLHRFCKRLFGVRQTGTYRTMDNLLCVGHNACARQPMLR